MALAPRDGANYDPNKVSGLAREARQVTPDEHHALQRLAAVPRGVARSLIHAHDFTHEVIAGLLLSGLATVVPEIARIGENTIEVELVMITDGAGRLSGIDQPANLFIATPASKASPHTTTAPGAPSSHSTTALLALCWTADSTKSIGSFSTSRRCAAGASFLPIGSTRQRKSARVAVALPALSAVRKCMSRMDLQRMRRRAPA